ncbi:hypothetical protein QYF36_010981 [Acer negundo]|nr:hypothetical protein QYF36_010981 [Acer negundo]
MRVIGKIWLVRKGMDIESITEVEHIPTINGKAYFPFGIWLRVASPIRKSNFHDQRGLSSSPVNRGHHQRYDRVSGTHQAIKEVEVLMGNGTERGVLNAKKVEEETCRSSSLGDCEIDSGSVPTGQVFSTQGDGSDLEAYKIIGVVYLPVRPLVSRLRKVPMIIFLTLPSLLLLGCRVVILAPLVLGLGVLKFGGKDPKFLDLRLREGKGCSEFKVSERET